MIAEVLLLGSTLTISPATTSPLLETDKLAQSIPQITEFERNCGGSAIARISLLLRPGGKPDQIRVASIACDPEMKGRLADWIAALPRTAFRNAAKATPFAFTIRFHSTE